MLKKILGVYEAPRSHWVGNGFPVRSLFSYDNHGKALSPFLLLDHAGPRTFAPTTTRRGVGEHPHRGFETVTIVYEGEVAHRDSTGAGGTIGPGDVQWMTAASGILHEEYHSEAFAQRGGPLEMVQLWVNLPARDKMSAPGYQTLLNGLDQDWAGSLDTMRAEFGRRLDRVDAPWFFDPVDHFFNRVLIPAIALTHLDLATWPVNSALEALSSKLVYRDLNIAGMLRQSERWHASISLANPKCDPALTWDRLFGDYVCEETGLAITCLGSSRELVDEGSPDKDADGFRGLSHCVASYDERCARYECAILSIREQDDGAKGMRVSTVELGINAGGVLTVIQHASFENLAPSEAAEMALARYMDAVNSGEVMGYASRLTMAVPAIPGAWEAAHGHVGVPRMDRTQREAAWALWRPLLSRDFRSMSLDDFATWLINHPKLQIQAAA